jgi:hypothetical protein
MPVPVDAVTAIHNAFRRDIEIIDAAALAAARGEEPATATLERFAFMNEVLEWHAHGEDLAIHPLLESVAPSVYDSYKADHRALDDASAALFAALASDDVLETARASKAFKFHLDLHLDKEESHMYRLIRERVPVPEQGQAVGLMASTAPQDRFPEIVAWMFPLIGHGDRVLMTRSWQLGMPPEGFAHAATLIEQSVSNDWLQLTHDVPELLGAS